MPIEERKVEFGRFGATAVWILVALGSGPLRVARLLDEVRRLDGHVGPGGLFGAVARLEQIGLIEPVTTDARPAYRLSRSLLEGQTRMEGFSR